VNVLAVCDNKMHFTYVYADRAGSIHDARVLRVSSLGDMLETGVWPSSGEDRLFTRYFADQRPDLLYRSSAVDFGYKRLPGLTFGMFDCTSGFGSDDSVVL